MTPSECQRLPLLAALRPGLPYREPAGAVLTPAVRAQECADCKKHCAPGTGAATRIPQARGTAFNAGSAASEASASARHSRPATRWVLAALSASLGHEALWGRQSPAAAPTTSALCPGAR